MGREAETIALYSGFERSFIDFDRGIRVGRLDPSQRITQIVKALLTGRHGVDVICDRWGRGVYWQWICWVPRPNREAKPLSSHANFSSTKFFIAVDREQRRFQAGFQLERAPRRAGADDWGVQLQKDWDWHVLVRGLAKRPLQRKIKDLLDDGFLIRVGPFSSMTEYTCKNWSGVACIRDARRETSGSWGVFQLFWPTAEAELRAMSGTEIVESISAVFDVISPAMDLCMFLPCLKN